MSLQHRRPRLGWGSGGGAERSQGTPSSRGLRAAPASGQRPGATGQGARPQAGGRFVSPRPPPPRTAAQAATRPSYGPGDRGAPRLVGVSV